MRRMIGMLTALGIVFSLSGCAGREPVRKTGFMMDTICSVTLYEGGDEALAQAAFELCGEYESLLSRTIEGSDISKINQAQGRPVRVDPRTVELLKTALEYTELTNGKFDITIGRLTELWDFHTEDPSVPGRDVLNEALAHTGAENLRIEGDEVTALNGIRLDLGGIAKGYIADRCADYLRENGVTRAVIDFGGNIVLIGSKAENVPWNVGIQRPFADRNEIIGAAALSDCSAVTSGIYERFFEKDGVIYHHILDPETGMPASGGLESVTVFAGSSTRADALSTSAFLLGREGALALIEGIPDTEAILIDSSGEVYLTSGIGTSIPFERTNE